MTNATYLNLHERYSFHSKVEIHTGISNMNRGCSRAVMYKTMDCGIVVRKFDLLSHY